MACDWPSRSFWLRWSGEVFTVVLGRPDSVKALEDTVKV